MLLSVSVDLDETHHYRAIHGLGSTGRGSAVYERAVPRLADWAAGHNVPMTWFAVGSDLESGSNAELVARLARRDDEIASHSHSHHYDLVRRSAAEIRQEIERSIEIIERVAGTPVKGFRAPGYMVSDTLLDLVREAGLDYDSSVFPCPGYNLLKAAKLAVMLARGRQSNAIFEQPNALLAPTTPYRVGRPFWSRGSGILEIPIQVSGRARWPFIGTALTMMGSQGARLLARGVLGLPLVNLELHGLDALDAGDGLDDLGDAQLDLRRPWSKKLEAIDAAVSFLQRHGYRCVRMHELAAAARQRC